MEQRVLRTPCPLLLRGAVRWWGVSTGSAPESGWTRGGCRLQHGDELLEEAIYCLLFYLTPRLALEYRSGSLPLAAERGVVRLRHPVAVERQQLESG